MKKNIVLFYLFGGIAYYFLIKEIIYTLDVFYKPAFVILMLLYIVFGYSLYIKNIHFQFIVYFLGLITLLFYRKSAVGFNFDFYLDDWLKYINRNKIILLNVIGNIIIFIPLGIYLKDLSIGLLVIILLEFLQVIFQRGMFDIVDIVLNTIGYLIGSLEVTLWKKTKRIKKISVNMI